MRIIGLILGLAVLFVAGTAGWEVGRAEIANMNLQEALHDMAAQAGSHIGFVTPMRDEEVIRAVILKAKEQGIDLDPAQVTVRRTNPGENSKLYLAADYTVRVSVGPFSFRLHFRPSSESSGR